MKKKKTNHRPRLRHSKLHGRPGTTPGPANYQPVQRARLNNESPSSKPAQPLKLSHATPQHIPLVNKLSDANYADPRRRLTSSDGRRPVHAVRRVPHRPTPPTPRREPLHLPVQRAKLNNELHRSQACSTSLEPARAPSSAIALACMHIPAARISNYYYYEHYQYRASPPKTEAYTRSQ